jgi:CBS domain-containing membrane protein
MQVRDVMTPDPVALDVRRTIGEALSALNDHPIRHLPLLEDGKLHGVLSDRSLAPWRAALANAERWDESGMRQLLTEEPLAAHVQTQPIWIAPDADVAEAVDLLLEWRIGALPVCNDDRRLVGIVSYVDLLTALRDLV